MSKFDEVNYQLQQGFGLGKIAEGVRLRQTFQAYDAEIARLRKALDDKDAYYKDVIFNHWKPELDAARADIQERAEIANKLWAMAVLFRRQRNAWYKALKQLQPEIPETTIRKLAREHRDEEIASMRVKWSTNPGFPSLEAELKNNENTSNPDDPAAV